MSLSYKLSMIGCGLLALFFFGLAFYEFKTNLNEQENKRVWVNNEHTACHYQDTLVVNGVKYLKIWDRENSGLYGDPYLVPVK